MISKNVCFQHDGAQPTKKMMSIECLYHIGLYAEMNLPAVCDFDLLSGKYSWVNEASQNLSADSEYGKQSESEVYYKKTSAVCREKDWLDKDLLGGRQCTQSTQCYNGNCAFDIARTGETQKKYCQARKLGESCSTSIDCDWNLYCSSNKEYPFLNTC